jgi:hypothetical protein
MKDLKSVPNRLLDNPCGKTSNADASHVNLAAARCTTRKGTTKLLIEDRNATSLATPNVHEDEYMKNRHVMGSS